MPRHNSCGSFGQLQTSIFCMLHTPQVKEKFYGCGNPIPAGIEGLRVLDLGCGSGRDCYVAAKLVGEKGSVTGE